MKYNLVLLFSLISITIQFSIFLPTSTTDEFLSSQICLGTPPECTHAVSYFSSCKSFIADSTASLEVSHTYLIGNSKTYSLIKPTPIDYTYNFINKQITGVIIKDRISISNYDIGDLQLLHASKFDNFKGLEALIGFCHEDNEPNHPFSFLDLVKPHSVISIEEKTLIIGRLPEIVISNYKQYGNCKIDNISEKWQCDTDGFIISDIYVEEGVESFDNNKVVFDYGVEKSLVSLHFLLFLEKVYFPKLIASNECIFGFKNNYYTFTCGNNNYDLKPINFIFGDWIMKLTPDMLFSEKDGEYEFNLYAIDGLDDFVLGRNILKQFTIVYDKTNNNFGFYHAKNVNYIGKGEIKPPTTYEDPDTPITPGTDPVPGKSGVSKFFKAVGIVLLIGVGVIIAFFVFRYFRRKRFPDQSYYYKATDDLFESGTEIGN